MPCAFRSEIDVLYDLIERSYCRDVEMTMNTGKIASVEILSLSCYVVSICECGDVSDVPRVWPLMWPGRAPMTLPHMTGTGGRQLLASSRVLAACMQACTSGD